MKNEIMNYLETETDTERTVSYQTKRAKVTVHIPKRTPEEQAAYEKRVKAALRRFYYSVTSDGFDWDTLVTENNLCS